MPRTAATPTVPFASQKKYRETHKETVKAVNRRYYENNKERLKAARKERYQSTQQRQPAEQPTEVLNESNETPDSVSEVLAIELLGLGGGDTPDIKFSYNSQLGVYVLDRTQYDNDYKKKFLKTKLQEMLNSL